MNGYDGFEKLDTIHLHSTIGRDCVTNLIIDYDEAFLAISSRIKRLICGFRHDRVYFAITKQLYENKIRTKDELQNIIKSIPWFSSVQLTQNRYTQKMDYLFLNVTSNTPLLSSDSY